ncbi:camphor resistance protein CrcB [Roseivivax sp. THAF40]|uniref:DUF302 domain-containing protein n=1 Tax=unclassified Roseivivax TaxID=2639302 RepID=UPI0012695BE3|nr:MULTISPECIES: DUF302 domain-containing protein [unclassified Roseivivax]QFS84087.1 camphor resistance protein CrcB [Roseivivax sp. THAF197b]QFT47914.1 camphor resistance protein CrcB [Roseivivax sp. THAF40]
MSILTRTFAVLSVTALSTGAAWAEYIETESPHSVEVTIDKLETAVKNAGATIFARVDHAGGAANVDMEMAPAELLIFGNPKLGTPAMQDDIRAGVQLPLRVLAYEDASGQVFVTYENPADMLGDLEVPEDAQYVTMMTGALEKLTGAAVAE